MLNGEEQYQEKLEALAHELTRLRDVERSSAAKDARIAELESRVKRLQYVASLADDLCDCPERKLASGADTAVMASYAPCVDANGSEVEG